MIVAQILNRVSAFVFRLGVGILRRADERRDPPDASALLRPRSKWPCERHAAEYELPSPDADCHLPRPHRHHACCFVGTVSRPNRPVCDRLHGGPGERLLPVKGKVSATLLLQCMSPPLAQSGYSRHRKILSALPPERWGN